MRGALRRGAFFSCHREVSEVVLLQVGYRPDCSPLREDDYTDEREFFPRFLGQERFRMVWGSSDIINSRRACRVVFMLAGNEECVFCTL